MTFSPPHHRPTVDSGSHDFAAKVDTRELRAWRLGRIQQQLQARCVKSPEEIAVMSLSVAVAETACARIREQLEPGRTEAKMWSILQATNAEMGGEYIETKLLTSSSRTNPWFQEAGEKRIRPGDLVSFATDLVGPFGYDADMSRTYFCGPGRPSGTQRDLYALSFEELHHNMSLLKAGLSFRDYAEQAWVAPQNFHKNWYNGLVHGIGLCNEFPVLSKRFLEIDDAGKTGFKENILVCVESYIGEDEGVEGVKLEQMVRITATGVELMTAHPFDEQLLA